MTSVKSLLRCWAGLALVFSLDFAVAKDELVKPCWSKETRVCPKGHYQALTSADFNGDGLQDIAAGSFEPGGIRIWLGNGDATWEESYSPTNVGNIRHLSAGDFNKDGYPDLMSISAGDLPGVRVWMNHLKDKNKPGWREGASPRTTGIYERGSVVDLNGDQALDIVVARGQESGGGVEVWFADLKARGNELLLSWSAESGPASTGTFRAVAVGDLDDDQHLDVVASAWGHPGGLRAWYGNGRGGWALAPAPAKAGNFLGLKLEHLDSDQYPDLVVCSFRNGIYILIADGNKGWLEPYRVTEEGSFWGVKLGDLNGDGAKDIVVSSYDGHGLKMWLQDKSGKQARRLFRRVGRFRRQREVPAWAPCCEGLPTDQVYYDLVVTDFNNDGRLDLAAASYDEGVHVWFQTSPDKPDFIDAAPEAKPRLPGPKVPRRTDFHETKIREPEMNRSFVTLGQRLFSVPATMDVEPAQRKIPPALREEFRRNKVVLTKDAMVRAEVPGRSWLIEDGQERYAVRKDGDLLKGYDRGGRTEYRVGAGDVIDISYTEGMEINTTTVTIADDGTVLLPGIQDEPVYVAGLPPAEIQEKVASILAPERVKKPVVLVKVGEYNSKTVSILGEIGQQGLSDGVYPLRGKTYVKDFIMAQGGPTPGADLRRVRVVRGDGGVMYLNLFKVFAEGDMTDNIILDHGDTVTLPSLG